MILEWWGIWVTLHQPHLKWSSHPRDDWNHHRQEPQSVAALTRKKWLHSVTKPEQPCYQIWLLKVPTRQSADTHSWRIQISHAEAKLFSPILLLAAVLLISVKSWKQLDAAGRGLWEFFHHSDVGVFFPISFLLVAFRRKSRGRFLQNIPTWASAEEAIWKYNYWVNSLIHSLHFFKSSLLLENVQRDQHILITYVFKSEGHSIEMWKTMYVQYVCM